MSFFAELKRRNVFRVGAAYLVVGWLLVQVVTSIEEPLGLPGWFDTAIIVLLAIGFPIALLFAWAYELTPEGVKKTDAVEAGASITSITGRKLDFLIIGALVLALGYFIWESRFAERATDGDQQIAEAITDKSIAVLPFEDLSPERDQEYFADGISEEILNVLARVDDLSVASRTSAFAFKGQNLSIREIAAGLEVSHVLEGSVRKAGNRVRITAQLIAADSDRHLWSETYDRDLTDIFAIQDEIAGAIAASLRVELGIDGGATAVAGTENVSAYDLYLLARHHWNKRNDEGLTRAAELFEQAASLDPGFARAYSGMGLVYAVLPAYTAYDSGRARAQQKEAAEKALAIDPESAEALSVLGSYYSSSGETKSALELFQRAIAASPDYPTAHHWYGLTLGNLGRFEDAIHELEIARDLEPDSPAILSSLAEFHLYAREYEIALELDGETLRRFPDYGTTYSDLFQTNIYLGRSEAARTHLVAYLGAFGKPPETADTIIAGLSGEGGREQAVQIVRGMRRDLESGALPAKQNHFEFISVLAALLGDDRTAIEILEELDQASVVHAPAFDGLRSQPRFRKLMEDWGIPGDGE